MKFQEDKLVNMTKKPSAYRFLTIILGLSFLFSVGLSAESASSSRRSAGGNSCLRSPDSLYER